MGRSPDKKNDEKNNRGLRGSEWKMVGEGNKGKDLENVWTDQGGGGEMCGICQVKVREDQMALKCDMCGKWFHVECMQMKKENYKKMIEMNDSAGVKWYCFKCEKKVENMENIQKENIALKKQNTKLQQENFEVGQMLKQLIERIDRMEKFIEKRIEEDIDRKAKLFQADVAEKIEGLKLGYDEILSEVNQMKMSGLLQPGEVKQSKEEIEKELYQIKEDIVREGVEEMKKERGVEEKKVNGLLLKMEDIEKERKKKNIMIFNLRESKKEAAKDRYMEDEENCKKIFTEELEVQNIHIEKVIRIGRADPNKVRPLMVKMGSEEEKSKILQNTKKLRYSEEFVRVYLARDLTEKEREKDRNLRLELKEKREKEDDWYIIKRGKVVRAEKEGRQNQGRIRMQAAEQPEPSVRPKDSRRQI